MALRSARALIERARKRIPMPARRRLASWRVEIRRPTSSIRCLPNLLIIGCQRGGTSSLYRYLGEHPSIRHSLRKETEYFSTRFFEGSGWYRSHFPLAAMAPSIVFEATPDYLLHPLAAARAASLVPEASIIAMLRDPVGRAYSQYRHNVALGHENLSFDEAVDAEPERIEGELDRLRDDPTYRAVNLRRFGYVERGKYDEQLRLWLDAFTRVHIVKSEEFYNSTFDVFQNILRFLHLSPFAPSEFVNHSLRTNDARLRAEDVPPMTEELESHLRRTFAPHYPRLTELIGRDMGWQ